MTTTKKSTLLFGMLTCAICSLSGVSVGFSEVVVESGPQKTSLLELYTSEGCSSCPPAEKWMASLLNHPGLWSNFVPIVFHVNYWDHLGWKDPFATGKFTARQRAYARDWHASSVYTPAFVLDGREWRLRTLSAAAGDDSPGRPRVERTADNSFSVAFDAVSGFSGGTSSLAILGFDRKSSVRSGENMGRHLIHQFVVLELRHSVLSRDQNTGDWTASFLIPSIPSDHRLGIAAWVSPTSSHAPIQAAGGWLSKNL